MMAHVVIHLLRLNGFMHCVLRINLKKGGIVQASIPYFLHSRGRTTNEHLPFLIVCDTLSVIKIV